MPPRALETPARGLPTTRELERDARRRYEAAIAAARESLRRAERRFAESAAAIAAHIQLARAADSGLGAGSIQAAT